MKFRACKFALNTRTPLPYKVSSETHRAVVKSHHRCSSCRKSCMGVLITFGPLQNNLPRKRRHTDSYQRGHSHSPSANRRQPAGEHQVQNQRSQRQDERQEELHRETSNQQQRTQQNTSQSRESSIDHEQTPEQNAEQPRRDPDSPAMRRYLRETDRWREFLVQDPNRAENMDRAFREWNKRCRDIFRRNGR